MNKLFTLLLFVIAFSPFVVIAYLGNTGIANDPNIYYSEIDPATGKVVISKGCRPSRLRTDGSCDHSFHLFDK